MTSMRNPCFWPLNLYLWTLIYNCIMPKYSSSRWDKKICPITSTGTIFLQNRSILFANSPSLSSQKKTCLNLTTSFTHKTVPLLLALKWRLFKQIFLWRCWTRILGQNPVQTPNMATVYWWCVHDLQHGVDCLHAFLDCINNQQPTIKFTLLMKFHVLNLIS